jgi:hypothetical protein
LSILDTTLSICHASIPVDGKKLNGYFTLDYNMHKFVNLKFMIKTDRIEQANLVLSLPSIVEIELNSATQTLNERYQRSAKILIQVVEN